MFWLQEYATLFGAAFWLSGLGSPTTGTLPETPSAASGQERPELPIERMWDLMLTPGVHELTFEVPEAGRDDVLLYVAAVLQNADDAVGVGMALLDANGELLALDFSVRPTNILDCSAPRPAAGLHVVTVLVPRTCELSVTALVDVATVSELAQLEGMPERITLDATQGIAGQKYVH